MRHAEPVGCFPTGRHYPGIAHLIRILATGMAEEFSSDLLVNALRFVSIDTETTGRDPTVDRIVEIACVTWENGEVIARKSWLVNPERPIPQEAFEVHGISDDDVKDKPKLGDIMDEVLQAMEGAVPVAYNAEYDRKVIHAEIARLTRPAQRQPPCLRRNVEWLDPLLWARELQKNEKGKSLGEVSARLGIEIPQAHRALDDAEAALKVLLAFLPDTRVPRAYGAFLHEQRRIYRLFEDERRIWKSRIPGS